jgi:hypothetical protein
MPNYTTVDLKSSDEDLKRRVRDALEVIIPYWWSKLFADSPQLGADAPITIAPTFENYSYTTSSREKWSAWLFEATKKGGGVQYFDTSNQGTLADPPMGQGALVVVPELKGCQKTELWSVKAKKIGPG